MALKGNNDDLVFTKVSGAPLIAQLVKNLPAMQETPVRFLSWEDPLEKGKATALQHSGLENSMEWQRVRHD